MNKTSLKAGAVCVAACTIIAAALCGCGYTSDQSSLKWVASIIDKYYYKDVSTDNIYDYTAKEFVSEYLDQYSAYYTAEEYAQVVASNSGSKSGIGISYTYLESYGVLISSVIYNSPAYKSGIRSGDFITSAVKGGEVTQFDSSSQFTSYCSELETGEEVTFYTQSGGHTVAKSEYTASYVAFATNDNSWAFLSEEEDGTPELTTTGSDAIEGLPDGAAYISLTQFYGDAGSQFAQAVQTLNSLDCTDIIIDLRNNGGGYVQVMQYISACFVNSGTNVLTAVYKSGSEETVSADDKYITSESCTVKSGTNVYVLANSNSASASEALIGVLVSSGVIDYSNIYLSDYSEDYLSLAGSSVKTCRTYGKGIMQSTYTRSSTGEALKLTTAQIYWPDGTTIHDSGVTTSDGATAVAAPYPVCGEGEELTNAIDLIFS